MGLGNHNVEESISHFLMLFIYSIYAVYLAFGYLGEFLARVTMQKSDWAPKEVLHTISYTMHRTLFTTLSMKHFRKCASPCTFDYLSSTT
jgi:hypothetical protein